MTDFLLELRSEEIPARMQDKAREDLARLFATELAKAGLTAGVITTYATPRRLALIARDLPLETAAVTEEVKGPKTAAPPQALEGFLRKTGLAREQLTERDGVFFAVTEKPGRATADVLAEAIPAIVRMFPWPKSMRWGAASASTESLRWVRPLHGIVALLGEELVPISIAGIDSGYATLGHRFHHPGPITIGSANDYVAKLNAAHVIVDQDARRAIIRDRASSLAAEAGLVLVKDEGLVGENAGLTEWPVPLLGRFDADFLSVPPEVIQLTARVNQKYFVCRDETGALANAFICTANIAASDGGATIVEGNRKVLAARLSDARFFYDTDLKVKLEDHAAKLDRIVFHEKLGTVADKVDRVAKLARWLVEEGIVGSSATHAGNGAAAPRPASEGPVGSGSHDALAKVPPTPDPSLAGRGELADLAERAARLAKADLVTGMVGEFPELQGLMGGYYAAAQGEDSRVAAAVRDHYKPVGQGDEVPTDPVTVAVSLADKLDTIYTFFSRSLRPTGSKDPFALRRAALGCIEITVKNDLTFGLKDVLETALIIRAIQLFELADERHPSTADISSDLIDAPLASSRMAELQAAIDEFGRQHGVSVKLDVDGKAVSLIREGAVLVHRKNMHRDEIVAFFADRLKVQQREAGVRHDLIDAVFALGGEDDLVRLLARVRALQGFVGTEDGTNLLAGYKRAANILKKEGYSPLPSREGPGVGGESHEPHAKGLPTPNPSLKGRGEEGGDPSLPARGEKDLSYTPEIAEAALIAALDAAEPAAARAVAAEDFEAAMAALATLRAPIDAFFENVTVNDPDAAKRGARLALLARVRDAVHTVADFSRIEG